MMMSSEGPINGQASIVTKEASREVDLAREEPMTNPKYRILTEDEILRLRRHQSFYWSKRMKEESNLLYRVRYSGGKVTQSFIEGVIESLESAGDFQITSFGRTKFILFVAGNQPPMEKGRWKRINTILSHESEKAVKRLEKDFEEVLRPGACYIYMFSRSKGKVYLSEIQRNTLITTLKPNISFFMKTWGRK